MRHYSLAVAAFIATFPFVAAGQSMVQSQEGIALENQILQLQNQVQQLQSSGGSSLGGDASPGAPAPTEAAPGGAPSGAAPSSDIVGSLLNQVSQLQDQVQQLNGKVDTLQNQVDTQHAATEKEIGDLNFKVTGGAATAIQGQAAPPGAQGSEPPPPLPPLPPVAAASPQTGIAAAQAALARHDYAAAEAKARAVLSTSRSSPAGYKAQFILAEALSGEGKPQDAAIAYDDAYNHDRSGTYAPASLLGLANALTDIQQQAAACDTLSSLNSQFPTPPAGLGPRIQAAEARAKCD